MANSALAAQYNCSGELTAHRGSQSVSAPSRLVDWLVASHSTPLQQLHSSHSQQARGERRQHSGETLEVGLLCPGPGVTTEMVQTSPGWIDFTVNCVKLSHTGRSAILQNTTQTSLSPGSPRKPVGEVAAVVSGPIRAREDQKDKAEWRQAGQSGGRF